MADDKVSQEVYQLGKKVDNLSGDVRDTNNHLQLVCVEVNAVTTTVDRLYNDLHLPGVALTDMVAGHNARIDATEKSILHHVEACEQERRRLQSNKWQMMIAMIVAGLALIGTLVTVAAPILMDK